MERAAGPEKATNLPGRIQLRSPFSTWEWEWEWDREVDGLVGGWWGRLLVAGASGCKRKQGLPRPKLDTPQQRHSGEIESRSLFQVPTHLPPPCTCDLVALDYVLVWASLPA